MNNNHPTFYKHLTVILAALLTTVVIALIALVLLLTSPADTSSDDPASSTPVASTPNKQPDQTTTQPVMPPNTTTGTSTSQSTTTTGSKTETTTSRPPVTDPPPVTTDPPIVEPPVVEPISGSVYGDSLASLKLYAEWNTVSCNTETGSYTLKLDFYCESFSLQRGRRSGNYIVINDERVEFVTDSIDIPSGSPKVRTLLYSTEYVVQKDDPADLLPVHIEFAWHNWGSYSGEYAEWLTLTADFVV